MKAVHSVRASLSPIADAMPGKHREKVLGIGLIKEHPLVWTHESGRKSMVIGTCAGRVGIGSVYQIGRATGCTGRPTPHIAAMAGDHAPATQITVDVATVPRAVRTAVIPPSTTSIPVTGELVAIDTPMARAAVA